MTFRKIIILLLALTVFVVLCGCAQEVSICAEAVDSDTKEGIPAKITTTIYANNGTFICSDCTDANGRLIIGIKLYGNLDEIEFVVEAAEYQAYSLKLSGEFIRGAITLKIPLERI